MSAFTTWTFGGVQFIAIPCDRDVSIIDENGENYGAWSSIDSFRARQRKGDELSKPLGGKVFLMVGFKPFISTPPG